MRQLNCHSTVPICREVTTHFDGNVWAANGPILVTRVFRQFCKAPDSFPKMCRNSMKLLTRQECFSIFYNDDSAKKFYEPSAIMNELGDSYFVHVWSKRSYAKPKMSTNITSIGYIQLAQKFCPLMLKAAGEWM